MNDSSNLSQTRPVAAQYVVTFLKPEMLHVFRQITSLHAFRPVVFCQKREQVARFPFADLVLQPKPLSHPLRRLWQKTLLRRPITIYRSEARRTLAALHQTQAQVLHVYFGHIGVHLLPLLEIIDMPVIVSFHGADAQVGLENPALLAATRRMFTLATLILARSQSLADRLVQAGCDPSKIRLHRTGIPLEQIGFRARTAPPSGAWRCLQACRLIAKKGLHTTLEAFAAFAREFPASTLTLAGEGPLLPELQEGARRLGVAGKVDFPGFLSQEQLHSLMHDADLFLHPSEMGPGGDQEGVPNSMLEAMAAGLPVLATTHGGIPEAVEHGVSGMLVAERDAAGLADAMLRLARDPARYAALSQAARERVSTQFDLGAQTRQLEAHYREAMALWGPH